MTKSKVKIPDNNEEPMEPLTIDQLLSGGAKAEKSFEAVNEAPTLVLEPLNKDLAETLQFVISTTNMRVHTPEMIYLQQILRVLTDMKDKRELQQPQQELKVIFKHEK